MSGRTSAASETGAELVDVLADAAAAVRKALGGLDDWGPAGTRPGQYRSDLAADEAVVEVLRREGMGVLSEESGVHDGDRPLLAVVDPVDGSTNAARGLPWWATSICVLDAEGPLAAFVVNQATGVRYDAWRAGGARRDGLPIRPSTCKDLRQAFVGLSGYARRYLGWKQYRALGAAALDMCAVADGTLDAYVDCSGRRWHEVEGGGYPDDAGAHGSWDYMGALLICREAGATAVDVLGRDLVARDPSSRRVPLAAGTPELAGELLRARLADA